MSRAWALIILLVMSGAGLAQGQDCQPQNDSAILVDLYGATRGLNWKSKWNLNQEFRKWHGISVNQDGCVTGLEVPANGLQGSIPNLDLPFLEKLDISGNNILSTLPEFSKVPALIHLNVAGNRFHGSLPDLANSKKMEVIIANNNQFDGPIPDYKEMSELRQLNLSNNKMTGQIDVITDLRKLESINLSNNQFQGPIPLLANKPHLIEVNLSRNNLNGKLPSLDSLENLTIVDFTGNRLSGSFHWPVNVPELMELKISDNELTDTIPPTGPVGKLKLFHAGNNQFTGPIPDMELPELTELSLSQNQLSGNIPNFAGLPALEQFSVRLNELEGMEFGPELYSRVAYSDVSENRMTFKDLVPFEKFRGIRINMFPQKKIPFVSPAFTVTKGNNYVIRLDTDEDDNETDFLWYQNGKRLVQGTRKDFSISNTIPRDAGEYTVTLVNSNFPGNQINSEVFTLSINCPIVIVEKKVYLCPGEEFEYKGEIFNRDATFTDTVLAQSDLVCDSIYFFDIQTYEPDSVHAEIEVCNGDIYYFGPDSIELTKSGYYLDTFPNIGGCDSIVRLDLTFRPEYRIVRDEGYCPGDSLIFNDSVYYADVDLVDTFSSVYGCDSIVIREVRFSDPVRTLTQFNICTGDSILIGNSYFSSTTSWVDTLQARGGCDSISTVEVIVRDAFEATLNVKLCSPETYDWQGQALSESGQYSDTLQTIYGCDSIVHLNLTVSPSYFTRDTIYMCQGDSTLFNGSWLTESGVYFSDKSTSNGCDSLNVLVLEFRDYAERWESFEICEGDTLFYNDKIYLFPGVYSDTLYADSGCDTLITLEVLMTEFILSDSTITGTGTSDSTGSIEVVVSGGTSPYQYLWEMGDTTAQVDSLMPGDYTLTVTDANGCTGTFILTVPVMTFVGKQVEEKNWISLRPNYLDRGRASAVVLEVHEDIRQAEISLYNELGIQLETRKNDLLQRGGSIQWQLGNLPAGMYYFHVREAGKMPFQVLRMVIF